MAMIKIHQRIVKINIACFVGFFALAALILLS